MALNDLVTGGNLGPEFEQGTTVANQITINVDGAGVVRDPVTGELSSPPATLTFDGASNALLFNNGQGGTANIDLSGLTTDIYVDGATFDAATQVLTLTDTDGATPDVTVDLSSLTGVSTDANNLLDAGTDGKPLLTVAALQTDLAPACQDVFGNDLFYAFPV